MPALQPHPRQRSSRGLFIGLSVLLLLLGGMVMDPQAGVICFGLAALFSLIPLGSAKGWPRYVSLALLVIALLLAAATFPAARRQHGAYQDKTGGGISTPNP